MRTVSLHFCPNVRCSIRVNVCFAGVLWSHFGFIFKRFWQQNYVGPKGLLFGCSNKHINRSAFPKERLFVKTRKKSLGGNNGIGQFTSDWCQVDSWRGEKKAKRLAKATIIEKMPEHIIAPCKGIRIPESRNFLLLESGILGFGIRNPAIRIRNPTKDWNPESKLLKIHSRLNWATRSKEKPSMESLPKV